MDSCPQREAQLHLSYILGKFEIKSILTYLPFKRTARLNQSSLPSFVRIRHTPQAGLEPQSTLSSIFVIALGGSLCKTISRCCMKVLNFFLYTLQVYIYQLLVKGPQHSKKGMQTKLNMQA